MGRERPTVAIDFDNTLANIQDEFLRFCGKKFNKSCEGVADFYDLSQHFGVPKTEINAAFDEFIEARHHAVRPMRGARAAVRALRDSGHRLHIITARPIELRRHTTGWLNRHFPKVFAEVVHTNRRGKNAERPKGDVCTELGVTFLIDDLTRNAANVAEHRIRALLLTAPWNQNDQLPSGVVRVDSWQEVTWHIAHHDSNKRASES